MADLIRDDWMDMMSAFYFPRLSKMIKDESLLQWIEAMRAELTEKGQEAKQIKKVVEKANRFMRDSPWIFEQLIATLLEEQMLEAVESVASCVYDLGF